jgi:hypothetical protein
MDLCFVLSFLISSEPNGILEHFRKVPISVIVGALFHL